MSANENWVKIGAAVTARILQPGTCILVFVAGFNEIEAMLEALEQPGVIPAGLKDLTDVFPLHSMIDLDQQLEVFKSDSVRCKVIVATNIAESSVTVPDVSAVVDFGRHKEIVYDDRRGMSCLRAQWVSRASAKQRTGRTGRVREGVV
jgi:HrpA-like RNA helicase